MVGLAMSLVFLPVPVSCVVPLGSIVFVTDVLLGDDNTVCVTCDLQRYFSQLQKHSWCEKSTSTLPLEKSTMQRIVHKSPQTAGDFDGATHLDGRPWGGGLFCG